MVHTSTQGANREGFATLGLVLNFCGDPGCLARQGTSRRKRMSSNRRSVLDDSDNRGLTDPIDMRQRRKHLLAAHALDQPLLPFAENDMWKDGKIPKYPQEIDALGER